MAAEQIVTDQQKTRGDFEEKGLSPMLAERTPPPILPRPTLSHWEFQEKTGNPTVEGRDSVG
jgi:hypothetical protein